MAESSTDVGSTAPGRYGVGNARLQLGAMTMHGAWNVQGNCARPVLAAEARRIFAIELPSQANTTARGDSMTAFWLGPESWLVVARAEPTRFDFPAQRDAINAAGGALFDVSAARVAFSIAGRGADALLARRCPLDFYTNAFPVDHCAQSMLGHVGALLYRLGADAFVVMVARTFTRDVWHALCVSAAADGYDVVPTTALA